MIAPQASAAFVAAMEKALDIYSRPIDVKHCWYTIAQGGRS